MSYADIIRGDGPLFCHPCQETSGTSVADISGNGNTGTLTTPVTVGAPGPGGDGFAYAYSFSGTANNSGWIAPYSPAVGSAHTLEAIVKPNPAQATETGSIIGRRTYFANLQTDFPIELSIDTSGLLNFTTSDGTSYSAKLAQQSAVSLADGFWHHVVGVFIANSRQTLWVDGVKIAESTTVNWSLSSGPNASWRIGSSTDFGGGAGLSRYSGAVCFPALYGVGLTDAQVVAHARAFLRRGVSLG